MGAAQELAFWKRLLKFHIVLRNEIFKFLTNTPPITPLLMRNKGITLSGLTTVVAAKYLFQKESRAPLKTEHDPKISIGALICHLKPPAPKEEGREDFFK